MKKMTKKIVTLLICAVLLTVSFPLTVSADTGPKPSVRISFQNMGDELCYATLLSQTPSTGPHSVWDGDEAHIYSEGLDLEIWRAFSEYEDPDGYYFLQIGRQVNDTKEFAWTYYPPNVFKILLYYPETGAFVSSGIYERYAFDSYYTVDMKSDLTIGQGSTSLLDVHPSYRYKEELLSLLSRILITLLIELAIALLFGYREKKQFLLLTAVNAVTQILLNLLLNLVNYHSGPRAFQMFYLLFELIVFAIEAFVYYFFLNRVSKKPKPRWLCIVYALVSNTVSFLAGLWIATWIPEIF